jgi:hypothetical protein
VYNLLTLWYSWTCLTQAAKENAMKSSASPLLLEETIPCASICTPRPEVDATRFDAQSTVDPTLFCPTESGGNAPAELRDPSLAVACGTDDSMLRRMPVVIELMPGAITYKMLEKTRKELDSLITACDGGSVGSTAHAYGEQCARVWNSLSVHAHNKRQIRHYEDARCNELYYVENVALGAENLLYRKCIFGKRGATNDLDLIMSMGAAMNKPEVRYEAPAFLLVAVAMKAYYIINSRIVRYRPARNTFRESMPSELILSYRMDWDFYGTFETKYPSPPALLLKSGPSQQRNKKKKKQRPMVEEEEEDEKEEEEEDAAELKQRTTSSAWKEVDMFEFARTSSLPDFICMVLQWVERQPAYAWFSGGPPAGREISTAKGKGERSREFRNRQQLWCNTMVGLKNYDGFLVDAHYVAQAVPGLHESFNLECDGISTSHVEMQTDKHFYGKRNASIYQHKYKWPSKSENIAAYYGVFTLLHHLLGKPYEPVVEAAPKWWHLGRRANAFTALAVTLTMVSKASLKKLLQPDMNSFYRVLAQAQSERKSKGAKRSRDGCELPPDEADTESDEEQTEEAGEDDGEVADTEEKKSERKGTHKAVTKRYRERGDRKTSLYPMLSAQVPSRVNVLQRRHCAIMASGEGDLLLHPSACVMQRYRNRLSTGGAAYAPTAGNKLIDMDEGSPAHFGVALLDYAMRTGEQRLVLTPTGKIKAAGWRHHQVSVIQSAGWVPSAMTPAAFQRDYATLTAHGCTVVVRRMEVTPPETLALLDRFRLYQTENRGCWASQPRGLALLYQCLAALLLTERDALRTFVAASLFDCERQHLVLPTSLSRDTMLDALRIALASGVRELMADEHAAFLDLKDADEVLANMAECLKLAVCQPWNPLDGAVNLDRVSLSESCVATIVANTIPTVYDTSGAELPASVQETINAHYGQLINRHPVAHTNWSRQFYVTQSPSLPAYPDLVPVPLEPLSSSRSLSLTPPPLVRRPSADLRRLLLSQWMEHKEREMKDVQWLQCLLWLRRECPEPRIKAPPESYQRQALSCATELYSVVCDAVKKKYETLTAQLADTIVACQDGQSVTPRLGQAEATMLSMLQVMLARTLMEKGPSKNKTLGQLVNKVLAAAAPPVAAAPETARFSKETPMWRACREEMVAHLETKPNRLTGKLITRCYERLAFDLDLPATSSSSAASASVTPRARPVHKLSGGWKRVMSIFESMYTDTTNQLHQRTRTALDFKTMEAELKAELPDEFVQALVYNTGGGWIFPAAAVAAPGRASPSPLSSWNRAMSYLPVHI